MELLGQDVIHKKYGNGIVTDLTDTKIAVQFVKGQKLFLFPDVFSNHMTVKNSSIQKKLDKLNENYLKNRQQEQEKINREKEYRNRIYTMKIPQRSQAVFDISQEEVCDLEKTYLLDIGCYVSGIRKGQPRIPSVLQPNSGILLTECGAGKSEKERRIVGAAMADDTFWGNECVDGKIRFHKEHLLVLPEKSQLPFWSICRQETIPNTWGSVTFKYFQNSTMKMILQEIRKKVVGTNLEKRSEQFYHYFCKLNRLA